MAGRTSGHFVTVVARDLFRRDLLFQFGDVCVAALPQGGKAGNAAGGWRSHGAADHFATGSATVLGLL